MDEKRVLNKVRELVCNPSGGNRHIVVLDRGWIFVGDLETTEHGYVLRHAKNIRKWDRGGFGGLTKGAQESGAVLDDCEDVVFATMIFAVPVGGDWDA